MANFAENKPTTPTGTAERLLSIRDLARMAQVHESTIRRWIARGEFPGPSFVAGGTRRWTLDAIRTFLHENE